MKGIYDTEKETELLVLFFRGDSGRDGTVELKIVKVKHASVAHLLCACVVLPWLLKTDREVAKASECSRDESQE